MFSFLETSAILREHLIRSVLKLAVQKSNIHNYSGFKLDRMRESGSPVRILRFFPTGCSKRVHRSRVPFCRLSITVLLGPGTLTPGPLHSQDRFPGGGNVCHAIQNGDRARRESAQYFGAKSAVNSLPCRVFCRRPASRRALCH